MLLISQSGETADTLAALRLAKKCGAPTLAVVNTAGSSMEREADQVIHTYAGPEIAVASTKEMCIRDRIWRDPAKNHPLFAKFLKFTHYIILHRISNNKNIL